ncbi:hypothetical protein ABW21_db0205184 [Orbilia brochopaga]|nr:hypothetical protein ABW21_db0205184 [Drechslerella brochopaga]
MDRWLDDQEYTIGWVCALPLELAAAVTILAEQHPPLPQDELDDNVYHFGRVGYTNVIIACLPSGVYGVTSAATAIAHMRRSFPSIKYCLMVGIAGGAPLPSRDIRLGDVVVSEPFAGFGGVLQYDFGKTVQEGRFVQTGVLNKPPKIFLTAIAKIKSESLFQQEIDMDDLAKIPQEFSRPSDDSDRLFQAHYDHPTESPSCDQCNPGMVVKRVPRTDHQPYVHYGLIASGNQVMKHGITRDLLAQEKGVLCFEMEAAGLMDEIPTLIIRGICDYSDSHKSKIWQPYAALVAAVYAKNILMMLPPRKNSDDEKTNRINLNLPLAEGAPFGSYADQHEPECLPGTRVELLDQVTQWAADPQGKSIFWLVGRAGTGKSTISRTVARLLQEKGWLGPSFFFKRGEADRSRSALFFTTIAHQLAIQSRYLAFHIQQAVQNDPDIHRRALREQYDKLIFQPLSKFKSASRSHKARLVLLIDALDECDQKEDVKLIIQLLSHLTITENTGVRIFLTSRPELPIRPTFKRLPDNTYKSIILHDVPKIKNDILLFIKHEMSKIRDEHELEEDWPDDKDLRRLVEMAVPLFIYAATLCRFIGDDSWDPSERIKTVLEYETGWNAPQLHRTYLPILDQLVVRQDSPEKERLIKEFKKIVGAIINLASPLSISSLARLLSIAETLVERRLKPLHSVLNVPNDRHTAVKVFHASFRDFLLDGALQEKSPFWIDEKESHSMIASHCIELMSSSNGLKRNLCALKSPGTRQCDIARSYIDTCISPELRYACIFLQTHLLHWLEAMCLLGFLAEAQSAVDALTAIIETKNNKEISRFVYESKRFILRNRDIIHRIPLQIYYSAIIFLPANSILRKVFNPQTWVPEVYEFPKVKDEWDAWVQTLKGDMGTVNALAFSPDGKLLASAAELSMKLWDSSSGALRQTIEDAKEVKTMSFSPDGKLLASNLRHMHGCTTRLWSIEGAPLGILEGHTTEMHSVAPAFSPDSQLLASITKDRNINLWDTTTRALLQTLIGHTKEITAVAFSPDGSLLASSSQDQTIRLWDITTGRTVHTENCNEDFLVAVFSLNGKALASASGSVLTLRDITTWTLQQTIEVGSNILAIAISPDSRSLVSGSADGRVRLWDVNTGALQQTFEGHCQHITAVAISPDSKVVASGSRDYTIRLWDVLVGVSVQEPEECSPNIARDILPPAQGSTIWPKRQTCMAFSPDGKFLVSTSEVESAPSETALLLWDTFTRQPLQSLKGCMDINRSAFLPDSGLLAISSLDGIINVWSIFPLMNTPLCTFTIKPGRWLSVLLFSPDCRLLTTGFEYGDEVGAVKLWDPHTGEFLRGLKEHKKFGVKSLAYSSDGKLLATGGGNHSYGLYRPTIILWDTTTWTPLQTLDGHLGRISCLAFTPDSKVLASGSDDFTVVLWDTVTGALLHRLGRRDHEFWRVDSIAISPDGRHIVSTASQTTKLWEIATGRLLQTIAAFSSSLSYSLDGKYLNTRGFENQSSLSFLVTPDCEKEVHEFVGFEKAFAGEAGGWLTLGKEKFIWVPEAVGGVLIHGDTVALNYLVSGEVLLFRFDTDYCSRILLKDEFSDLFE